MPLAEAPYGVVLTVETTQPGPRFYSADSLDGSAVDASGHADRQTDGFALEAEQFPDAPNHPAFPTTLLAPGDTPREETVPRCSARRARVEPARPCMVMRHDADPSRCRHR